MSTSYRFDAPLHADGYQFGDRGGGILSQDAPTDGQDGASIIDRWTTGADDGSEMTLFVTSMPVGLMAFWYEDGSVEASAPDGSYTAYAQLRKDYVDVGSPQPITFTFGAAAGDTLDIGIVESGDAVVMAVLSSLPSATAAIAITEAGDVVAASVSSSLPSGAVAIEVTETGDTVAASIMVSSAPVGIVVGFTEAGDIVSVGIATDGGSRSMESILFDTLKGLVGNRVFPSVAPELTPTPYITYQSAGGEQAINFMDGEQPSKKNARIQINVWDKQLVSALALAQRAETALRGASTTLSTTVLSGQRTTYEQDTKLHGTIQFFSCWADISST